MELIDKETVKHLINGLSPIPPWAKRLACLEIEKLASVEAVPVVRGKWIATKYYTWECSNCGFHPFKGYIPKEPNFNFYPNCSADMRKKVQECD